MNATPGGSSGLRSPARTPRRAAPRCPMGRRTSLSRRNIYAAALATLQPLRPQDALPEGLPRFDRAVCVGGLLKRKLAVDLRLEPPLAGQGAQALHHLATPLRVAGF